MEALKMENITKIYPNGFVANKGITFSVQQGEIHALVGENGAGKTTLMKVLFGMEQPQEGAIYVNEKKVKISSPLEAISLGVGMVHQHFMLLPSMTVAQNVTLGMEPRKNGLVDTQKAVQMTQEMSDKYRFGLDASARVGDLSVGLMQKVEILRAVHKYKDSREQFEQRTHKRLIDVIAPNQKVVDALSKLEMPAGVSIDIKMK